MSKENENYQQLKTYSLSLGASLFGIADIIKIRDNFRLSDSAKKQFPWGISLGKRAADGVLEDIQDQPTPLYFHHYRQLNIFLDRAAFLLTSYIQELGFRALPIPASQIIDWEKQQAHVSHKKIGFLAGLGWIGRNNLLVNPRLGSRFRLVTVLTDLPLEADQAIEGSCGECRRCLMSCPAQAIKTNPADFDHIRCFEKLDEFRKKHIVSQHICGVCVKACPGPAGSAKAR